MSTVDPADIPEWEREVIEREYRRSHPIGQPLNPQRAFLAILDADGKVYAVDIDCREADVSLELDRSHASFGPHLEISFRANYVQASAVDSWIPPSTWGSGETETSR